MCVLAANALGIAATAVRASAEKVTKMALRRARACGEMPMRMPRSATLRPHYACRWGSPLAPRNGGDRVSACQGLELR